MIEVTIVDASGEIVSVIQAPDDEHIALNTPDGAQAIPGRPPAVASYYANEAWVAKPAQPAAYFTWDSENKVWVDQRPLAQALSDKLAELTTAYAAAIAQNVSYTSVDGVAQVFQADPDSINDVVSSMLGCQAAQATPPGFFWVAADNTHVPFTFADLQGLAAAIFAQGAAAFTHLQQLKVQARAATTTAQLEGITWATTS